MGSIVAMSEGGCVYLSVKEAYQREQGWYPKMTKSMSE